MIASRLPHDRGQSLWLNTTTCDELDGGTIKRYVVDFSVTGSTANPMVVDHAITNITAYDVAIRRQALQDVTDEGLTAWGDKSIDVPIGHGIHGNCH